MIDQLTVFLGNKKGRLTAMCHTLGEAQVQMHALTVADTSDYGIVRVICDRPNAAMDALKSEGFAATLAKVLAVQSPDVPGGAAQVFEALDNAGFSIEYAYCFSSATAPGTATLAIKADGDDAADTLAKSGFNVLHPKDIYAE